MYLILKSNDLRNIYWFHELLFIFVGLLYTVSKAFPDMQIAR